jgi:hypothetical protein
LKLAFEEGMDAERSKMLCLEGGECSLLSDRDGFPKKTIEIVLLGQNNLSAQTVLSACVFLKGW